MNALPRIHIWLAGAALAFAAVVGLFFLIQTPVTGEACYGVRAFNNPCEAVTPAAVLRLIFVIAVFLALFVIAYFGARWQHQAQEPTARTTALMAQVTCALLLTGMTVSSFTAAGRYLAPSVALLLLGAVIGVIAQIRGARTPANAK